MTLEELLIKIGFVTKTEGAEKAISSLKKVEHEVAIFGVGLAAASAAATAFIKSSLEGIAEQSRLATQNGMTIQQLRELTLASDKLGISHRMLERSLKGLNSSIAYSLNKGTAQAKVFQQLGISVRDTQGHLKSALPMFQELSEKLAGKSAAEQANVATRLGINGRAIRLIQQGKDGLKEFIQESKAYGIVTQEQGRDAIKFTEGLKSLEYMISQVKTVLAASLAPEMTELVAVFTDWFSANQKIIGQDLKLLIGGLVYAFRGLLFVITPISEALNIVSLAVKNFKTILGIAATSAGVYVLLNLPSVITKIREAFILARDAALAFDIAAYGWAAAATAAIVAVSAAIYLVVEDLWFWYKGGNSLFKELWQNFEASTHAVQHLKAAMALVVTGFKQWGAAIRTYFVAALNHAFLFFEKFINSVVSKLDHLPGVHIKMIPVLDKTNLSSGSIASSIAGSSVHSLSNQSTASTKNTTNNNKITINVNGAKDPSTVAKVVSDHLQNAARSAQRNNSSPVAV